MNGYPWQNDRVYANLNVLADVHGSELQPLPLYWVVRAPIYVGVCNDVHVWAYLSIVADVDVLMSSVEVAVDTYCAAVANVDFISPSDFNVRMEVETPSAVRENVLSAEAAEKYPDLIEEEPVGDVPREKVVDKEEEVSSESSHRSFLVNKSMYEQATCKIE